MTLVRRIDMNRTRLDLKPLSVNEAWQGRRFKTSAYKKYEYDCFFLLPLNLVIPKRIKITFTFGFSNPKSDVDNPTKMLLDIMQKKYLFNDSDVWECTQRKELVKKGCEFVDILVEEAV